MQRDNPDAYFHFTYQRSINRITATSIAILTLTYLYLDTLAEFDARGLTQVAPAWLFWSYFFGTVIWLITGLFSGLWVLPKLIFCWLPSIGRWLYDYYCGH